MLTRETTVGLIAALLITFTAWAWGGVVLWTQWVTAGLGLLALVVALLPSTREKWKSRTVRYRLALAIAAGIGVLVFSLVRRLLEISETREATLQLIPNAELPPLAFSDWGETPLLIGLGTTLFLALLTGLLRPSGARRRLIRFWPFWIGLFLFTWISCQSLNTWGKVIQRELYWHIVPQDYIAWLPSGLDAPFDSTEEPGGMNGWRQLLIFVGPWALLCGLRAAVLRRRTYSWLAGVAALNALGVTLVGNMARAQKWKSFLGIADPELKVAPFGPFIYQNQAGAYLCLACAAALALMFYLAKRRGDKVDRGGPHLVVAIAALFLALGAASTMSFGAVATACCLLFAVAPVAYLLDCHLRTNLSPLPALAIVVLGAVVIYIGLLSADAKSWRLKVERKERYMEMAGSDDRAPLRRATWTMLENVSWERQLSGWGAGSYRWVSPVYLRSQPEFLSKKGELIWRATHAHNDWLQAPIEWGLAGWAVVIVALAFFALRVRAQFRRPRADAISLFGATVLFSSHLFFDFLLFTPQLVLIAVLACWLQCLEIDDEPVAGEGRSDLGG